MKIKIDWWSVKETLIIAFIMAVLMAYGFEFRYQPPDELVFLAFWLLMLCYTRDNPLYATWKAARLISQKPSHSPSRNLSRSVPYPAHLLQRGSDIRSYRVFSARSRRASSRRDAHGRFRPHGALMNAARR